MTSELETAAADSLPHLASPRRHAPAPGTKCPNCDTPLAGPFCHACGQSSDDHRRSLLHLCIEVVEDLFHLDGRLGRTLPDLFLHPGRLARDLLERRIARHVPPFRMFLVTLLVFMVVAEHEANVAAKANEAEQAAHRAALATPAGRASEAARLRVEAAESHKEDLTEAEEDRRGSLADGDAPAQVARAYQHDLDLAERHYSEALASADRVARGEPAAATAPLASTAASAAGPSASKPRPAWKARVKKATENPEFFFMSMFELGHRLAVLMLPILGFTLALAFRSRKELFVYDHMLVAMQLLSFQFLLYALVLLLPTSILLWGAGLALLWPPVNLWQTVRAAYHASVIEALLKTALVWLICACAAMTLLAVLVFVTIGGF